MYVTQIYAPPDDVSVYDELYAFFSPYGCIYEMQILIGDGVTSASSDDTVFAFVKFYLRRDAERARAALNGAHFRAHRLHVRVAQRRLSAPLAAAKVHSPTMPVWRCIELANYLFGCTGWRSTIDELAVLKTEEATAAEGGGGGGGVGGGGLEASWFRSEGLIVTGFARDRAG